MSDPSAIQIPISTAVSSDLLLGLKSSAVKSRSYRISIPPINKSSFVGQDMIVWELPTGRRGTFYDASQSYLKFSVSVQTTADSAQGGVAFIWTEARTASYNASMFTMGLISLRQFLIMVIYVMISSILL